MAVEERIDMGIFRVVTQSITESRDLETMTDQLTQLLVGTLGIKGCTLFVLNRDTDELEILANFGLSINYLNKGPILINKSIDHRVNPGPVVIRDIGEESGLQYPEEARKEGIHGMISLPIKLYDRLIGVLRLYHFETWDISEKDLNALSILAEMVGLAIMYSRLLSVYDSVKDVVDHVHPVWVR